MASSPANQQRVQHPSSRGEPKTTTTTPLDDSLAIFRKHLRHFHEEVAATHGLPVQVTGDVSVRIGGPTPKEHVLSISAQDTGLNSAPPSSQMGQRVVGREGSATSPPAVSSNGQHHGTRTSPVEVDGDDERPSKRARFGADTDKHCQSVSSDDNAAPPTAAELRKFMHDWHKEWTTQGGWLFDTISAVKTKQTSSRNALSGKLDFVQDVLGQSINTASASTMNELASISKLIPWVEQCRKASADKTRAREEKWRTSSANFHDQARRDREAAEKRIEKKLDEQRQLLVKIAKANGVDLDNLDEDEGEAQRSDREESLGAQLTAELNAEALRSRPSSKYDTTTGSIRVDD